MPEWGFLPHVECSCPRPGCVGGDSSLLSGTLGMVPGCRGFPRGCELAQSVRNPLPEVRLPELFSQPSSYAEKGANLTGHPWKVRIGANMAPMVRSPPSCSEGGGSPSIVGKGVVLGVLDEVSLCKPCSKCTTQCGAGGSFPGAGTPVGSPMPFSKRVSKSRTDSR